MIDISFGKLQGKLMASEKYNAVDAAILTEVVIDRFSEDVRKTILDWADGVNVDQIEIDGVAVKDVADEIGCSTFQALCILNAVREKPDCFAPAIFTLTVDSILESDVL